MKTLLSLLLFLFAAGLQAQVQLRIIDQGSGLPLDQVRVTSPNGVQTSTATGILIFAGDNLRLRLEREGYETLEKTFPAGEFTVALLPVVLNLSQVTVTAFDSERPLLQQAAAVSLVSESDLFRFNESSPVQAFNQKAGVRIEERAPASYRISIRGSSLRSPFGVRNVKVYWNDVPFTSPDGTTSLNLLDLSNIRSAEVIKGPSGSMYGAGNGGVISLFSQAEASQNRLTVETLAGDFGLSRYRVGISQQLGTAGIEASYVRQESDGYRVHSGVNRQVMQLSGVFPISAKQTLRTQVLISDLNYQIPGALTAEQRDADPKQARPGSVAQNSSIDQQSLLLSLGHRYAISDRLTSTTTVYLNTNALENPFILDYKKELGFGYGARTKLVLNTQLAGKTLRLIAGGEWQQALSDAQNFGNRAGKADTIRFADRLQTFQGFLFQQAELNLSDKLLLTLGLSENFSGYDIDRQVNAAGGKTGLQTRSFTPILVPRLAANYQFNPFSSVYGSISSGFSPPTLDEVRTNEGSVNLDLEAEKGLNYEVGYRLGKGRLNVELIAYYLKLDETITTFANPNGVVLFQNAGATDQKGIEASVDYAIFRNKEGIFRDLLLGTAYTGQFFTFTDYKKRGQDFSGNDLTGVPAHNLVSRLDLRTRPGIYLNFTHQFTEEIPLNDANTIYQDPYSLVNLRVGWLKSVGDWELEIFAGLDNLLDASYSLGNDLNAFAGRFYQPAPTRNGYGGVKLGWKY